MKRIRISDFDRRLVLEAPVNTQDDTGGIERSWVFIDVIWARVTALVGICSPSAPVSQIYGCDLRRVLVSSL
jgi:hypothetical protein